MTTAAEIVIAPPDFQTLVVTIRGTTPFVQNKFSQKAREEIRATQEAGSQSRSRKKRTAKDFDSLYRDAQHVSTEGWVGIPAVAFRSAMIDACRLVGFKMTHAKQAVFVEADDFDADDGTPLVKFTKGDPRPHEGMVRNATGVCDIRIRPMWSPGWEAELRIVFDAGMFSATDVVNLLMRAGRQVGVGEGRPFSKSSHGQGWGMFTVVGDDLAEAV